MQEYAIEVNNVSMCFNMSKEKIDNLKEYIIKLVQKKLLFEQFWALNDISFKIKKGESVAIMGLNGSGKSTILKIIAGILKPTNGNVKIKGNISPLIELGAGFDLDLTARENIFLNGAILGYSKKILNEKFYEIIDFSELEEFIDVPIKNYSSGMVARLAFSVATIIKPEILIIDEILSVGDFLFQQKCEKRMKQMMQEDGVTVIFVSHSISQIYKICERAIWLERGKLKMDSSVLDVCSEYEKYAN